MSEPPDEGRADRAEQAATVARAAGERAAIAARAAAARALAARSAAGGNEPVAADPVAADPPPSPEASVELSEDDAPVLAPWPEDPPPGQPLAPPETIAEAPPPPVVKTTPTAPAADVRLADPAAPPTPPRQAAARKPPRPPDAGDPGPGTPDRARKRRPAPPPAAGRPDAGARPAPSRAEHADQAGPAPATRSGDASAERREAPKWLAVAGLIVAVWAALPHFVTPPLDTEDLVEIVDHVVPGLVVFAVCLGAVFIQRRPGRGGNYLFVGGLVLVLAGLWMVATHLPLVAQATREEAPWAGTIYHSASALSVLAFSLIWMAANWNAAEFSEG